MLKALTRIKEDHMYKSLAFFVALAALALPAAVTAQSTDKGPHSSGAMKDMHGSGSSDMHGSMMKGMKGMQSMKMSGDVDKDFAMMMKMHHQMAIDMAQVQMSSGKSSEMKSMARKMSGEQKKDINSLNRWLNKHQ